MRYFMDAEFNEGNRKIDLISFALVAEDDREFYVINSDARKEHHQVWVQENVWPYIYDVPLSKFPVLTVPHNEIKDHVKDFIGDDPSPEFWGYYCDYDWVLFCWLWGTMV